MTPAGGRRTGEGRRTGTATEGGSTGGGAGKEGVGDGEGGRGSCGGENEATRGGDGGVECRVGGRAAGTVGMACIQHICTPVHTVLNFLPDSVEFLEKVKLCGFHKQLFEYNYSVFSHDDNIKSVVEEPSRSLLKHKLQ